MAIRLGIVFLLVALACAMVVNSSPTFDSAFGISSIATAKGDGGLSDVRVGDFIDDAEEMMMESESTRRTLRGRGRRISYGAMRKGATPCNRRGASYYSCNSHGAANPYRRGCSRIARCSRNTR
ncbi:OLC1v1023086C1 [Oldenlandia corymbosa var. corymbosa]|uniref:OLC1v1023086C1 n=1 Tax=Oldenlandia corymbosa var. corymbosa TaxID=529605 RepID=A0AAV1C2V9_OLDCO|nr:OLC1v1023086C1 [Oldenlandia corymbosa var. corymbosa]